MQRGFWFCALPLSARNASARPPCAALRRARRRRQSATDAPSLSAARCVPQMWVVCPCGVSRSTLFRRLKEAKTAAPKDEARRVPDEEDAAFAGRVTSEHLR